MSLDISKVSLSSVLIMEVDGNYFVGWGTLSLINAGLAQGKNRSGLNWFLLSLFLGPLATFLLVVMDPLQKE
jgi:hypothetical protein